MRRVTIELPDEEAEHIQQQARAARISTGDALRRALKPKPVRRLVTVAETAERLSVSKPTIYRLCREGKLRSRKVKGALRIDSHSLTDYMDGKR